MYDAGALLAVDSRDRRRWVIHHLAIEEGRRLLVPAVVVARACRAGRRQGQWGRILNSCEVLPIGTETAKAAGVLCGKAGTRDVVDAVVVTVALAYGAIVFTSDPGDITDPGAAAEVKPDLVVRRV